MIYTLRGIVTETDVIGSFVVIECGGVGYKLTVTANTMASVPSPAHTPSGDIDYGTSPTVRMYTHMTVKDDGVELYGFSSKDELDAFKLLTSVSGVGPKAGMSILSLLTPKKLAFTIANEDTKTISRAPGVGGKTAARVILELKDKMAKAFPDFTGFGDADALSGRPIAKADSGKLSDAQNALAVLGYSRSEIAAAMKNADMSAGLEDIIKQALAALMKQ